MATIALYGLGALGVSFLAAKFFAPKMPGPADQEGPRLSDVKAAGSSYGAPLYDLFGASRVDGNIIWCDDIKEVSKKREVDVEGPNYDIREYFYFVSFAVQLCRGEILGIRRIWGNNKLVYNQAEDADAETLGASNALAEYMTVYTGTEAQMPDPTIAAKEGMANTPAFRGTAYVVFEQLPLENFLNNFPRLSFEVVQKGTVGGTQITRVPVDLSSILQTIAQRAGIDPLRIDSSGVSSLVRGTGVGGKSHYESIAPLLAAYNVDAFQSGYSLKFRRIEDADVIDIDAAELGRDGKSGLQISRKRESDLPRSKLISYYDVDRDYLAGTQNAPRQGGRARNDDEIRTTLSLTATEAKRIAETALYAEWLQRLLFNLKLPPPRLGVEPGDILRITDPQLGLLVMRAKSVVVGADLSSEIKAAAWNGTVLESNAEGDPGQPTDPTIPLAGATTLRILDIAAISDAQAQNPFLLFAASGASPWRSASLYRSIDNRATYQTVMALSAYSTQGTTLSTLPSAAHTVWDTVNTIDVQLQRGTPQSASDIAVLAGANLALVGDELVQFATATLIAPGQWRLSRLLRGRRGTDWAKGLHGTGERVVLINTAFALQMAIGEIGATRWWRAPSQDQALADSDELSIVYQALALKPYSPVFLRGARNGGNDLAISWIRRSRINTRPPAGEIPLGEASERYEVEIVSGSTPVRSTIVTSPAWTYTSAMQIADFGSNQAAVSVNIFQLSATVGRGYSASANL